MYEPNPSTRNPGNRSVAEAYAPGGHTTLRKICLNPAFSANVSVTLSGMVKLSLLKNSGRTFGTDTQSNSTKYRLPSVVLGLRIER